MKQLFYKLSFKQRIWISIVLLVCVAVSVTGILSYNIAAKEMKNNALQLSQNSLDKSAQALDDKLRKIIVSVMTITIDDAFIEMLKDVASSNNTRFYTYFSKLQTPFTQMKLNEPTIDSILVSTPLGEFFPTNNYRSPSYSFRDSDTFQRIVREKSLFWTTSHMDQLFTSGERVISLVMEPTTSITISDVYIVVNVLEDALLEQIANDFGQRKGAVLLLSANEGNVLSASPEYEALEQDHDFVQAVFIDPRGTFEYTYDDTQYLVNYAKLKMNKEWVLVSLQSKDDLLNQVSNIKWATMTIIAVSIVFALLLSNVLTILLLRPLNKLRQLMQRAGEHNLTVRFNSEYKDEVTQVGLRFNSMLDELQALIHKIKDVELDKRKAEMKALQAQIDPHFLYNTLNSVFWRCLSNQHDAAKEIVVSLSRLFELGLNKGLEITTVDQELIHVEQYLIIQQLCYTELFNYEIIADPDLRSLPLLKIILQPLVENSILHGFRDFEDGGKITIKLQRTGSGQSLLELAVTDNGAGMDVDKVYADLRDLSDEARRDKGYALRNVFHRLQLYYGEQAGIRLESVPFQVTTVTLYIPLGSMQ